MQKHQDILQQVGRMALATAGCSAIMLAIYAVVGRFTTAVLLGGLLGTVIAVGNFLALSITVSNALDRAAAGDNSVKACMSIQSSSVVRTAILAVIYVLLFHAKVCDPLAALLPLLFAQAAIKLIEFFRKDSKGGDAVPLTGLRFISRSLCLVEFPSRRQRFLRLRLCCCFVLPVLCWAATCKSVPAAARYW